MLVLFNILAIEWGCVEAKGTHSENPNRTKILPTLLPSEQRVERVNATKLLFIKYVYVDFFFDIPFLSSLRLFPVTVGVCVNGTVVVLDVGERYSARAQFDRPLLTAMIKVQHV